MSESDQTLGFEQSRLVAKKILAKSQSEGNVAVIRRSSGRPELKYLDSFLLLDEFEDLTVSSPAGFPDHPHRGFEALTYMLQWMIVHSEMPESEGTQRGLQLWINLSSKDKMVEPRYQELLSEDIPKAEKDGIYVKIIAGEAMGVQSSVHTRIPTMYLDFTLQSNTQYHQSIQESWNANVYTFEGEGVFGILNSPPVEAHHLLVLGPGEGSIVWNKSSMALRFILVGGKPLNEPVVQQGLFVMNTQAEIEKTMEDYFLQQEWIRNSKDIGDQNEQIENKTIYFYP